MPQLIGDMKGETRRGIPRIRGCAGPHDHDARANLSPEIATRRPAEGIPAEHRHHHKVGVAAGPGD